MRKFHGDVEALPTVPITVLLPSPSQPVPTAHRILYDQTAEEDKFQVLFT